MKYPELTDSLILPPIDDIYIYASYKKQSYEAYKRDGDIYNLIGQLSFDAFAGDINEREIMDKWLRGRRLCAKLGGAWMGRTIIPSPVWRLCHRQLEMYTLQKAALADLRRDIIDGYEGRNQTVGRDGQEVAPGGGGSIHHSKMDAAIEKLTGAEIVALEHDIECIEDVYRNLTPRQQQLFDLHYRQHYNLVDVCKHMAYCRRAVQTVKAEVVEKTAVRLGYMR